MTQRKAQSERTKLRQETKQATAQTKNGHLPEYAARLPFAASMHLGTDTMKHWMEASQDMARFYNGRLSKDFGYITDFASCRSPSDVTALWWRIASEAAHDYADQLDRIIAINLNGAAGEERFAAE